MGCLLLGVALECPSWPVVVVVGVGRWGRLVGGEDLRATVHLGYVPSLGVILSLHLLDVVADIACDVVVVNLESLATPSASAVWITCIEMFSTFPASLVFVVLLLEVLVEVCNSFGFMWKILPILLPSCKLLSMVFPPMEAKRLPKVLEVFLYVLFRESVAKVSKFVQQVAPVGICTHLR